MSRATARWDASKCITITETPVLNTFVWVAHVHSWGVPPPPRFSSLRRQQAAGVHSGGPPQDWGSGVWAERSVSRLHLFSPAHPPYTCLCLPRAQRRSDKDLLSLGIPGGEKRVEGGVIERMELVGARLGWVVSGAFAGGRGSQACSMCSVWSREQPVREKLAVASSGPWT